MKKKLHKARPAKKVKQKKKAGRKGPPTGRAFGKEYELSQMAQVSTMSR